MSATKLNEVTKKLKATGDVHLRRDTPTREPDNKKGIIYSGFEVEITEEWRGEAVDGNDRWYRDKNGDFLWSGGFEEDRLSADKAVESPSRAGRVASNRNYNEIVKQVPLDVRQASGEGVKVAIIDSGAQVTHECFSNEIECVFNAVDESTEVRDLVNHGTHIAGIIGARNNHLADGIIGIAPQAELCICKVSDEKKISADQLRKALEWAIHTEECDVINVSLKLKDVTPANADDFTELKALVKDAIDRDIAVVAAAGNNSILTREYDDYGFYPAGFNGCTAVGAISQTNFDEVQQEISGRVDYILPFEKIYSASNENGQFVSLDGCSMSTAVLAGIMCLIKSGKKDQPLGKQLQMLRDFSQPFQRSSYANHPFKLYYNENK